MQPIDSLTEIETDRKAVGFSFLLRYFGGAIKRKTFYYLYNSDGLLIGSVLSDARTSHGS